MKRFTNYYDFVWWLVATGAVFTLFLWSLNQMEKKEKNWIDTITDEELEDIEYG